MKPSSQPPRTPSRLSDSVHHQLNLYALAAGAAGVSLLALAQPAGATIVYTKTHKIVHNGMRLDLRNNHVAEFVFGTYIGCAPSQCWNQISFNGATFMYDSIEVVQGRHAVWVDALSKGAVIGPRAHFGREGRDDNIRMAALWFAGSKTLSTSGDWINVTNRYIGLKFRIHGKVHYGWARLNVILNHLNAKNAFVGTLTGYAYETIPNKAIIAGKTKGPDVTTVQPGSLGRLAQGSAGLLGK